MQQNLSPFLVIFLFLCQGTEILFAQKKTAPIQLHITIENQINIREGSSVDVCIINGEEGRIIECKKTTSDQVLFNVDPAFNYRISVAADGFNSYIETLQTKASDTKIYLKIQLKESAVRLKLSVSKWPENDALSGCTVTLTDMSDISTQQIMAINQIVKSNDKGNDFLFGLLTDKEYQIVVAADGYKTYTENIHTTDLERNIFKNIRLHPELVAVRKDTIIRSQFITPISLYFDHDCPKRKPNHYSPETEYSELSQLYLLKKEKYRKQAKKELNKSSHIYVDAENETFFNEKIGKWKNRLDHFLSDVEDVLNDSAKIELEIFGYSSSKGNDEYNKILCKRRIDVIMQEIKKYNDGKLQTYMAKGSLMIIAVAVGADNGSDLANNFSNIMKAANKRRVELKVKK